MKGFEADRQRTREDDGTRDDTNGIPLSCLQNVLQIFTTGSTHLFSRMGNKFDMYSKSENEFKQQNNSLKVDFVHLLRFKILHIVVMVFYISYNCR